MSLQRRLGLLDLTLIAIGAVIGSGIFRNPAVVAHRAPNAAVILGCWIAGCVLALIADVPAFVVGLRDTEGDRFSWLQSNTRKKFIAEGGLEVDLPDLLDVVVDATILAHPIRCFHGHRQTDVRKSLDRGVMA